MKLRFGLMALAALALSAAAAASQSAALPGAKSAFSPIASPLHSVASQTNEHDHAKMNERGEKGMGFSQTATTHHFLLKPDGGVIQVEANDPKDTASRDEIRMHLTHIAHAFASGDFEIPMFVHDKVPPGVPEMKKLAAKITYTFEQTPNGGRVLMRTTDADALAAIHKFLSFQIDEHQTHDPATVK